MTPRVALLLWLAAGATACASARPASPPAAAAATAPVEPHAAPVPPAPSGTPTSPPADRWAALERPGWTLAWSDEFDGPALDPARWRYDQGGAWSNGELQFYTARRENVRLEAGQLVIEARREDYGGNEYTSGRIDTFGKASFTYGRMEARMRVPPGLGLWPAFWMLGDAKAQVGWPGCGEIDVVEVIGRQPATVHGTVHGASFHGAAGLHQAYQLPAGALSDAWHVFAVEWEPGELRWYVDDVQFHRVTPGELPIPEQWPFDKPFHLILDLAVGGSWSGDPDDTTPFPAQLRVDYVRVYQRAR